MIPQSIYVCANVACGERERAYHVHKICNSWEKSMKSVLECRHEI